MYATTFDTLEFTEQLRAAGVPDEQAKGHAKALAAAMQRVDVRIDTLSDKRDRQMEDRLDTQLERNEKQIQNRLDGLATKQDLDAKIESSKSEMKRDIKELELRMAAEIAPLKWGMAVCVGGIIALILKSFFPH